MAKLSARSPKAKFMWLAPSRMGAGGAAVAPFVGPLDALPAVTAAYSMRRLLSAYIANKAINVRRASDSAAIDVGFVGADLDVATLTAFLAATTGFITTWYDQSGGGLNVVQGTAANQPGITLSQASMNNRPVVAFDAASSQRLTRAATPVFAQPFTFGAVAQRTAAFTSLGTILCGNLNNTVLRFLNAVNQSNIFAGTNLSGVAADATSHALAGVFNGASSSVVTDGTTVSGNAGASANNGINIGCRPTSVDLLTGIVGEVLVWASDVTASIAALQTDQKTYWGTP